MRAIPLLSTRQHAEWWVAPDPGAAGAGTAGIHQIDGDLGVLDPASGAGVLALHPTVASPFLRSPVSSTARTLLGVTEVLDHQGARHRNRQIEPGKVFDLTLPLEARSATAPSSARVGSALIPNERLARGPLGCCWGAGRPTTDPPG